MTTDCPGYRAFQEIKWNLRGYPLARMLRDNPAVHWFPHDPEWTDDFPPADQHHD